MPPADDDFITIARVIKTQGRVGEVACEILTDFPEKFAERKRLFLSAPRSREHAHREVSVEKHWFHKGQVVLKFAGVDSISDAESLIGSELQIPASERAPLDSGAYFVFDLVGCTVFDSDTPLGVIRDVNPTAGTAPLLLVEDLEIPFAEPYLVSVDLAAKQVRMRLPEGLVDLNR